VWTGAHCLCLHLESIAADLAGKRVLELGSGCGLSGLLAAYLGAKAVVLTDEFVDIARENLDLHAERVPSDCQVSVEELCWGKAYPPREDPPFNFVIGSDITYFSLLHNELLFSIGALCSAEAGTRVLIAADFKSKRTDKVRRINRCPCL
jgi:predicted nicotinamide N-methyase